jgi:hypothetical protein
MLWTRFMDDALTHILIPYSLFLLYCIYHLCLYILSFFMGLRVTGIWQCLLVTVVLLSRQSRALH